MTISVLKFVATLAVCLVVVDTAVKAQEDYGLTVDDRRDETDSVTDYDLQKDLDDNGRDARQTKSSGSYNGYGYSSGSRYRASDTEIGNDDAFINPGNRGAVVSRGQKGGPKSSGYTEGLQVNKCSCEKEISELNLKITSLEKEFYEFKAKDLRGPQGPPGLAGKNGMHGERGEPGVPGREGSAGPIGPIGPQGPQGKPGLPGSSGIPGKDGYPGKEGPAGQSGTPGSPGQPGSPGSSRGTKSGNYGQEGEYYRPAGAGAAARKARQQFDYDSI